MHARIAALTIAVAAFCGCWLLIASLSAGQGLTATAGGAAMAAGGAATATGGAGGATWSPQPGYPKPGTTTLPREAATVFGSAPAPSGNLAGYVFPVLGGATYTDTFGAYRSDTGKHEGNDLFADEGTPVVAPADGTLDRVGWNPIGGYRLWVFDAYGNGFYMCHLSAYAVNSVDGAHVRAGQVIAFVGHTGDAATMPNHLHFELHPKNGPAVDPYSTLRSWHVATAVPLTDVQNQATGTYDSLVPAGASRVNDAAAGAVVESQATIAANSALAGSSAFATAR